MQLENREALEAKLAKKIGRAHVQELKDLLDKLGDPPDLANLPDDFWDTASIELTTAVLPVILEVYLQSAEALLSQSPIGVDWGLVNQAAINWASAYSFELIKRIVAVSRKAVADALTAYYQGGMTIGDLEAMLVPVFGPVRAEMIAVTEITRASVEGELALVRQIEAENEHIKMIAEWQTNVDERVCLVCGPRNGKKKGDGWEDPPPAHPRCRCWLNHEMTVV